jgi:hypothetical protein
MGGHLERDVAAGLLGAAQIVEKALDREFVDIADQRNLGRLQDRRRRRRAFVTGHIRASLRKAAALDESGRHFSGTDVFLFALTLPFALTLTLTLVHTAALLTALAALLLLAAAALLATAALVLLTLAAAEAALTTLTALLSLVVVSHFETPFSDVILLARWTRRRENASGTEPVPSLSL